MRFQIHPHALCESSLVGKTSQIGAFSHVQSGASIGEDCDLANHVFVEGGVRVGDRVTIQSGVQLWAGLEIGDDVVLGANVTFCKDVFPPLPTASEHPAATCIEQGASIGANSTILWGVRVGRHAVIAPGSVITADVPIHAIVEGNPGTIIGYADAEDLGTTTSTRFDAETVRAEDITIPAEGVCAYSLRSIRDLRGDLAICDFAEHIPFTPKRMFLVYDVSNKHIRGAHAHRACHQFLIAVHGDVTLVVDDGQHRAEIGLNHPGMGLHVPPMVWATQYGYSEDGVLLVLASESYDETDYIRDYEDFLAEVK
jgi:UDP-2-acetamido-3-amino-2,3-dideoxy-glucuronate N-acetyltransferase